jgi:glycerol-3-phosphate dehydrogenase
LRVTPPGAVWRSRCANKLIHGGLRYLEFGQIAMVRKALQEREVLLRTAPHLVHPLRLVLVHDGSMRPAWMLRAGLWLYDRLGGRSSLPASRPVGLRRHPCGVALRDSLKIGFEFSDGWTDDSRLVATAALDAAQRGARILTRTRVVRARRADGRWLVETLDAQGRAGSIHARSLVNACGPWAAQFVHGVAGIGSVRRLRLVKGSHIVVRRRLPSEHALMLQAPDRRIAFAIPYEREFTLLGTTEVEFDGDPGPARADPAEIDYLCDLANRYLRQPIARGDVAWTFSGVRPLLDDGSSSSRLTRDFSLELDRTGAPLLNVWGGKITTFRTLGEQAVDLLAPLLDCRQGPWTGDHCLPGGDLDGIAGRSGGERLRLYQERLGGRHPWLDGALLARWVRAYGSRTESLLGSARGSSDLGAQIGAGLYEAELDFLARTEWARSADDVLWRRTKLGLHLDEAAAGRVEQWFSRRG